MWITKFFYLLLTGIVYLFFCLYMPQFSAYLLVSMLLLPFGFFAAAHFSGTKLRAELFCTETQAEKGVPCRCVVQLHNPTWLPMGTVTFLLTAKNITLDEETEQEFQTTVPPRDTIRMEIPVTPVHCGKFQVTVTNFRVYDSIHLFSHRKRLFRQTAFPVLPIVPEPPAQDYKPSVSGEAAVMQPTTEPEEFLGVRNYRSGDRMRAIHWKLSSRFPEPVVREYGIPRRVPAVIGMLYALQPSADGEPGTRLDAMLEALTAAVEMMCGEALNGVELYGEVDDAEDMLEADEWYPKDLVGLEARMAEGNGLGLSAGKVVGKVVDVVDSPAQSLLKIRLTEPVVTGQNSKGEDVVEKTALVPFVEALVPDIDLEEQYLTLDPPGGLIPGCGMS